MSTTSNFAAIPRNDRGALSAANTARDGTGTVVDIFTAGASGSRVDDIDLLATASTTAGVIRLFIWNGTNYRLWKEILVTAVTPSTTQDVWSRRLTNLALILPANYKLAASTHNAETFMAHVSRGGDF